MFILGISAFYHDSAAALIHDGQVIAAAQEERFTRKKHDPSFPDQAVQYCLSHAGVGLKDLDAVVFYDKPLLKFERLLETYYAFSPQGFQSFTSSIPVWIKEKVALKKLLLEKLRDLEPGYKAEIKLLFPEHHLSHAASAFYPSPFTDAALLTIDGVGEWATASICYGQGRELKVLRELKFPHSLGLLYSAFTYYLGFRVNSGEYKLMGLAPYGNPNSESVSKYVRLICDKIVSIYDDGSIWLNQDYFDYSTGLKMVHDKRWEALFGFGRRPAEGELTHEHCDLALAIQQVTEEIVIKMATEAQKLTGSKNLCLAGGVALNCVSNGKLLRSGIFEKIWIQPAAGDAGGAVGAALAAYHLYFKKPREADGLHDQMQGSYLGPEYSHIDIERTSRKYQAHWVHSPSFSDVCARVAELISEGHVIGWFQGRSEWGPRSLGNRSILGDPRNSEMQKRLNLKIKYRESFRPFAPSVLFEDMPEYFEIQAESPYMLLVADVLSSRRRELPANYHALPLKEKLYYLRSDMPAVTHLDFSARVQSVHRETNPRYWELLQAFKKKTGYGVLVNTSFNVRGEPIVLTPEDAYRCFMRTEMDYLILGNYIFEKKLQPKWQEKDNWKEEYSLD